jgi:hypothetical protein
MRSAPPIHDLARAKHLVGRPLEEPVVDVAGAVPMTPRGLSDAHLICHPFTPFETPPSMLFLLACLRFFVGVVEYRV